MRASRAGLPFLLALAACANYPRDIEGTSEHVAAQHRFRVGVVAGPATFPDRREAFLAALERKTGARASLFTGSAEPLLLALDRGELDLVIGELSKDTPWVADVAVIEPLATRHVAGDAITLSPIARNGESRWVMTLEEVVRDLGPAQPTEDGA